MPQGLFKRLPSFCKWEIFGTFQPLATFYGCGQEGPRFQVWKEQNRHASAEGSLRICPDSFSIACGNRPRRNKHGANRGAMGQRQIC
ncbi:MAG: hypothetical protein JWN92_2605 [Candidatus Acidoferrum typicum]|nr:hypothetical protein [Candidatus Acidoferrum typicum]